MPGDVEDGSYRTRVSVPNVSSFHFPPEMLWRLFWGMLSSLERLSALHFDQSGENRLEERSSELYKTEGRDEDAPSNILTPGQTSK